MIKSMWTVLAGAIDRAGLAVASAEHAYNHYGQSFTRSVFCRHWAEGFFEGLALGLKKVRTGEPAFDSTYTPSVTFKIVGASLLVEAMLTDAAGNATPVVSTLNYVETMSAASGLETLRNTGVFALTDDQAAELIRCAEHMRSNRSYMSPKNLGLSRPATH